MVVSWNVGLPRFQTLNNQLSTLENSSGTLDEEEVIAMVLSGQPISSEKLKEAREGERMINTSILNDPTLSWSSQRRGAQSSGALALATHR
jgi:hypothetical protein